LRRSPSSEAGDPGGPFCKPFANRSTEGTGVASQGGFFRPPVSKADCTTRGGNCWSHPPLDTDHNPAEPCGATGALRAISLAGRGSENREMGFPVADRPQGMTIASTQRGRPAAMLKVDKDTLDHMEAQHPGIRETIRSLNQT